MLHPASSKRCVPHRLVLTPHRRDGSLGGVGVTDQRYTGPDGAKRLEMLEELAAGFAEWVRASPSLFDHRHTRDIAKISKAISWDNARVERLEKQSNIDQQREIFDEVVKDFEVPLRGLADAGSSTTDKKDLNRE